MGIWWDRKPTLIKIKVLGLNYFQLLFFIVLNSQSWILTLVLYFYVFFRLSLKFISICFLSYLFTTLLSAQTSKGWMWKYLFTIQLKCNLLFIEKSTFLENFLWMLSTHVKISWTNIDDISDNKYLRLMKIFYCQV
jgi:hypothetical protein